MRSATPITDRIVRVYEVILWPDSSHPDDGPINEPSTNGPFEPFTITLGYPADKLPEPYADSVKREALKVALRKHEGFESHEMAAALASYRVTGLRLKQAKFIPAAQTFEAGAPRRKLTDEVIAERAAAVCSEMVEA